MIVTEAGIVRFASAPASLRKTIGAPRFAAYAVMNEEQAGGIVFGLQPRAAAP